VLAHGCRRGCPLMDSRDRGGHNQLRQAPASTVKEFPAWQIVCRSRILSSIASRPLSRRPAPSRAISSCVFILVTHFSYDFRRPEFDGRFRRRLRFTQHSALAAWRDRSIEWSALNGLQNVAMPAALLSPIMRAVRCRRSVSCRT